MKKKILRLFAAIVLLATANAVHATVVPSAENLLPADTFVFFTVPDFNALRAAGKVSPQLMFWNDPAMKPFRDHFIGGLDKKYIGPLEANLGVKLADFADLPQGQLTIGVTLNGSNGHDDIPPGLLLLLDAKGKSDSLKTNLAVLTKKWTDSGRPLRTQTIDGTRFTVITLSTNDLAAILPHRPPVSEIGKKPKPAQPADLYIAQFDSLLIIGNSVKVVEPVIAHLTGGSAPALADNATFNADKLLQFRDSPTYFGWFDAKTFFHFISQAADNDDSDPTGITPRFNVGKILSAIGLNGLKSVSIAMRESHNGSAMTVHLNAPENARAGILKMLALPNKDASIPAFVPDSAIKFSRCRIDGKQTWTELQKTLANISPQILSQLNSAVDMVNTLAQQKTPGFDLRDNLFNNLGDDIISYEKAPVGSSLRSPSLTLIKVVNTDQVVQSIKAIASLLARQDEAPTPRDFRGHKIYSIALRPRTARDGSTIPVKPLLVSSKNGYIALTTDTGILEEYLRNTDAATAPLNQTAGLSDAIQHIGGTGGGLFGYQNQLETMRFVFKLWKNERNADLATRIIPPAFRELVDFSLLPDFSAVSKYFYLSVYGADTDNEGLTLKMFNPRPPQLN